MSSKSSTAPSHASSDDRNDENKHEHSPHKKSFKASSHRSKSRASSSRKTETSPTPKPFANLAEDDIPKALQDLTGDYFRRSRCDPEFLEKLSREPTIASGNDNRTELTSQVKVVTGLEAVSLYTSFLKYEHALEFDPNHPFNFDSPLVFASIVLNAGRRCVDYYLSWRGKMRAKELKDRDADFLDSEFKRLSRRLDREYKKSISPPTSIVGVERKPTLTRDATSKNDQDQATPESQQKTDKPPTRDPVLSSKSSVMSLPLLNMVRNVPFGNRVPLRVTNPDLESDTSPTPRTSRIFSQIRNSFIVPSVEPSRQINKLETLIEEPNANEHEDSASGGSKARSSTTPQTTAPAPALAPTPAVPTVAESVGKANSSAPSTTGSSREFIIVVLDEHLHKKRSYSWHGLDRKVSTKAQPQRSATDPQEVSPWVGPLAPSDGSSFSTPPSSHRGHSPPSPHTARSARWAALNPRKRNQPLQVTPSVQRSDSDSDSSEGDEPWMTSPVIPLLAPGVAPSYGPIVPLDVNQMQAYGLTPMAPQQQPVIPGSKYGLPTPINSTFPVQPALPKSVPVMSAVPVTPGQPTANSYVSSPVPSIQSLQSEYRAIAQKQVEPYSLSSYRPAVMATPLPGSQAFLDSPYSTSVSIPPGSPYNGAQPYMNNAVYPGTPYQMMDRPVMG
ncbi:hypothetical protein AX16_000709 [Volvariella volvacea WC 439]|nr:hypothetical protein AX16_000709 [Volvariella volvacea WC 439]